MSGTLRVALGLAVVALLALSAGCDETKKETLDGIAFGLDMGAVVSASGVDLAVSRDDFPGCVVACGFVSLCAAGAEQVRAIEGNRVRAVADIAVDLSKCEALMGGFEPLLPEVATSLAADAWRQHGDKLVSRVQRFVDKSETLECYEKALLTAYLQQISLALPEIVEELGAPDGIVKVPAVALTSCP